MKREGAYCRKHPHATADAASSLPQGMPLLAMLERGTPPAHIHREREMRSRHLPSLTSGASSSRCHDDIILVTGEVDKLTVISCWASVSCLSIILATGNNILSCRIKPGFVCVISLQKKLSASYRARNAHTAFDRGRPPLVALAAIAGFPKSIEIERQEIARAAALWEPDSRLTYQPSSKYPVIRLSRLI